MAAAQTESGEALRELIALIGEIDERCLGPEWNISEAKDVAEGHRHLMHLLASGLVTHLEADPERPRFQRIVAPTRKLMGDNPDALYYEAPVRPDRIYRVRGNLSGAVYTSITVEAGATAGQLGTGTGGLIRDDELDVGDDGSFELIVGGARPERGSWLPLPDDAGMLTTRHYFEEEGTVAADPLREIPLIIEPLDPPDEPPPPPTDESVAASIRRVVASVRSRTLGLLPPAERKLPPFVSMVPNTFNPPVRPGDHALAAADAAYTMAPYFVMPEQALVMRGRFPSCRFANVVLWNRFLQTYDYVNRRVSLNRAQATLDDDGSFRMVIAHEDPGVPNWLDTEGRPFGLVFWRFMLPEGEIETPTVETVPLAELRK